MSGRPPVSTRAILALVFPALGTLAADPILSLIDTAFVASLGQVPLAALGVDTALFAFAFAVFNFLAYATTPLVAQARGRGDIAASGTIVRRALVLAVGIGLAANAVLFVLAEPLVRLMRAAPEVVDPAVGYLRVRSFAVVALLIITAANGAYRGFKDTRTPLWVTLAVNGLNVVLDALFILGLGFGLRGAATATVVAQWIGALVFLGLLRGVAHREEWPTDRVRLGDLREFGSIGSVLVVRTLLLVSSLSLATAAAAEVGTVAVAAHQVVAQVWFLLAMLVDAIAIAAQALVAEEVAVDGHAARRLAGRLFRWGVWAGAGLAVAIVVLRGPLASAFAPDEAVRLAIVGVLPIAAAMQPLAAWLFVADGVFLALLATRLLALSTAAGFVAVAVVLGLSLASGWGLAGVWWAMTAMVAARSSVLGVAYVRASPTLSRA